MPIDEYKTVGKLTLEGILIFLIQKTFLTVFLLDEYVELENKHERSFYLPALSLNWK